MTVSAQPMENSLSLSGEVVPRYESAQGFRINGKIVERRVETGTAVRKGQLLARLDPKDPQLSATASRADVQVAEASLALAQAEVKRYRQLAIRHFVSASALDVKEAELKTATAKLAQLKAQARVMANQADYSELVADRDGIVTLIHAEPGQVVQAGEVIAKIADTHTIEVLVNAPESRLSQIRVGDPVRIRLWAKLQQMYSGKVREIAPAGNPSTRTFNVRVTVTDADNAMKLGMTARASFSHSDSLGDTVILIPGTALTEIDGKKTVWVIDSHNKAHARAVSTGQFGEQGIPVYSGLTTGETIAVAGVHTLVPEQTVTPITPTP
jgi:membrane fusion protein, multidrug efflux system